jgi:hypothetical protein
VALIVAVVWLLLIPTGRYERPPPDLARDILTERHARGEIGDDEYPREGTYDAEFGELASRRRRGDHRLEGDLVQQERLYELRLRDRRRDLQYRLVRQHDPTLGRRLPQRQRSRARAHHPQGRPTGNLHPPSVGRVG